MERLRTAVLLCTLLSVVFLTPERLEARQENDLRVRKIEFEGNRSYSDIVLAEVVANESVPFGSRLRFWRRYGEPFSEMEVRRDVVRLQRFYQRRGFPEPRIVFDILPARKSWQRNVKFVIDEGTPILIRSVEYTITGMTEQDIETINQHRLMVRARDRTPYRVERRFETIKQDEVRGEFINALQNMGYAFARVTVSADVDSTRFEASIRIDLDPGPPTKIGRIHVEGQETVNDRLIIRESALRTGQRFNQRRLSRAQQEIFSHHLFRFVTINIPEQPRDSTVDLNIRVREYPLRSINLMGGVGTEEILRGAVTWMHRNPFGNAHNLSVSARASFLEQRAKADYLIPYVFNTNSSIIVSPYAQRLDEKNFFVTRYGATNSLVYQYNEELAGTISYEFSTNEEAFSNELRLFRDSTETYRQSSIKLSGYYSKSFVDQDAGWAIRPYIEFSGFFGSGELTYNRYALDVRRFIDIGKSTQLAMRANGSLIFADDDTHIPASLLNYLGGTNSVRGWGRWDLGPKRPVFREDNFFSHYVPKGGRHMLSFNVEIRQHLDLIYRGLGIAIFLDGGQLWDSFEQIHTKDLQYGAGFGMRYRSPIGPIRIDIGYKLNPTNEDLGIYQGVDHGGRFPRLGLHFNIGHAF